MKPFQKGFLVTRLRPLIYISLIRIRKLLVQQKDFLPRLIPLSAYKQIVFTLASEDSDKLFLAEKVQAHELLVATYRTIWRQDILGLFQVKIQGPLDPRSSNSWTTQKRPTRSTPPSDPAHSNVFSYSRSQDPNLSPGLRPDTGSTSFCMAPVQNDGNNTYDGDQWWCRWQAKNDSLKDIFDVARSLNAKWIYNALQLLEEILPIIEDLLRVHRIVMENGSSSSKFLSTASMQSLLEATSPSMPIERDIEARAIHDPTSLRSVKKRFATEATSSGEGQRNEVAKTSESKSSGRKCGQGKTKEKASKKTKAKKDQVTKNCASFSPNPRVVLPLDNIDNISKKRTISQSHKPEDLRMRWTLIRPQTVACLAFEILGYRIQCLRGQPYAMNRIQNTLFGLMKFLIRKQMDPKALSNQLLNLAQSKLKFTLPDLQNAPSLHILERVFTKIMVAWRNGVYDIIMDLSGNVFGSITEASSGSSLPLEASIPTGGKKKLTLRNGIIREAAFDKLEKLVFGSLKLALMTKEVDPHGHITMSDPLDPSHWSNIVEPKSKDGYTDNIEDRFTECYIPSNSKQGAAIKRYLSNLGKCITLKLDLAHSLNDDANSIPI